MVFQNFNLFPHLTALENVAEAPVVPRAGPRRKPGAGAWNSWTGWASRTGPAPTRGSCPAASSSAWRLPGRWRWTPKSCCSTSPPPRLDPELVNEVLDVIRELAKSGTTLIIVTHEMGFARDVADTVVFMDQGQIVEQGSPEQIFTNPQEPRTRSFFSKVLEPAFNI